MAMTMTNWFGDGNGYVGNIDLKPEVAHTLSATADWHSEDSEGRWWRPALVLQAHALFQLRRELH
jgi:hypothetical protein